MTFVKTLRIYAYTCIAIATVSVANAALQQKQEPTAITAKAATPADPAQVDNYRPLRCALRVGQTINQNKQKTTQACETYASEGTSEVDGNLRGY